MQCGSFEGSLGRGGLGFNALSFGYSPVNASKSTPEGQRQLPGSPVTYFFVIISLMVVQKKFCAAMYIDCSKQH